MRKTFLFLLVVLILAGCREKQQPNQLPSKAEVEDMNRLANKKEAIQIREYVDRMQWPTVKTGSGLHYYIYEHGTGDSAKPDMQATIRMTITLLNGDTCYSWLKSGEESFTIEHAENESGLHEALQHMRKGDKAKVVLPSYLAFGLIGDMNKVPPRCSLVYDLYLVNLK